MFTYKLYLYIFSSNPPMKILIVVFYFQMEYVAMLSDPGLVLGLEELLADNEHTVVKRTIRVFANVYRHALELLATGELEYETYKAAWPAVKSVAESLIKMVPTAENEGVLVHLVRFLEAILISHLMSDVSRYPDVIENGKPMIENGIKVLKNLVTTPYVGGTVFIVGIKGLISVACYKLEMRTEVIDLVKRLIKSPPPTLFDHNVRSFHKILQRNLFRLLRRSEVPEERGVLIEMMVSVGVHRKLLTQWAPPAQARKRQIVLDDHDRINFPPSKKSKNGSPPSSGRNSGRTTPEEKKKSSLFIDNTLMKVSKELESKTKENENSSQSLFKELQDESEKFDDGNSNEGTPSSDQTSLNFLKSVIRGVQNASANKLQKFSDNEKVIYQTLNHKNVVDLVFSTITSVPDSPPENMAELFTKSGMSDKDNVDVMRNRITKMLTELLTDEQVKNIESSRNIASPSCSRSNSPSLKSSTPPLKSNSPRSTPPLPLPEKAPPLPTSTPPILDLPTSGSGDVDLRKLLGSKDIDMRLADPRQNGNRIHSPMNSPKENFDSPATSNSTSSDPRLNASSNDPRLSSRADPRLSNNNDPRLSNTRSDPRRAPRQDPRLNSSRADPRLNNSSPNHDPRIQSPNSDPRIHNSNTDPRKSISNDPRLSSSHNDPRLASTNSDPRMSRSNSDPRLTSSNSHPRMSARIDPRLANQSDRSPPYPDSIMDPPNNQWRDMYSNNRSDMGPQHDSRGAYMNSDFNMPGNFNHNEPRASLLGIPHGLSRDPRFGMGPLNPRINDPYFNMADNQMNMIHNNGMMPNGIDNRDPRMRMGDVQNPTINPWINNQQSTPLLMLPNNSHQGFHSSLMNM